MPSMNTKLIIYAASLLLITASAMTLHAQSGRRSSGNHQVRSAKSYDDPARTVISTETVEVTYEGGEIGFGKSVKGTLAFDHVNNRMSFHDKKGAVQFTIPYRMLIAAYADTRKLTPFLASAAANSIPYGAGLPALLIKRKARYLILHHKEADTDLQGVVAFRFKQKEELAAKLEELVAMANLTPRGNIFVRFRSTTDNVKAEILRY